MKYVLSALAVAAIGLWAMFASAQQIAVPTCATAEFAIEQAKSNGVTLTELTGAKKEALNDHINALPPADDERFSRIFYFTAGDKVGVLVEKDGGCMAFAPHMTVDEFADATSPDKGIRKGLKRSSASLDPDPKGGGGWIS